MTEEVIQELQILAPHLATKITKERLEWIRTTSKLVRALEAVLLFYSVGPWTGERRAKWLEITGEGEATTKVLCDHIRGVLN